MIEFHVAVDGIIDTYGEGYYLEDVRLLSMAEFREMGGWKYEDQYTQIEKLELVYDLVKALMDMTVDYIGDDPKKKVDDNIHDDVVDMIRRYS